MRDGIQASAELYMRDGEWRMTLNAPDWVMRELFRLCCDKPKRGFDWLGGPTMSSGVPSTDMMFALRAPAVRVEEVDKTTGAEAEAAPTMLTQEYCERLAAAATTAVQTYGCRIAAVTVKPTPGDAVLVSYRLNGSKAPYDMLYNVRNTKTLIEEADIIVEGAFLAGLLEAGSRFN